MLSLSKCVSRASALCTAAVKYVKGIPVALAPLPLFSLFVTGFTQNDEVTQGEQSFNSLRLQVSIVSSKAIASEGSAVGFAVTRVHKCQWVCECEFRVGLLCEF